MKKNEKLKFFFRGKIHSINIEYVSQWEDKIPMFISDNIDNIQILKFGGTESIIIVASRLTYEAYKKDDIDLLIWYYLLTYNKYNYSLIDYSIANWFGFQKTIDFIKHIEHSKDEAYKRANKLEKLFINNISRPTIDKEAVLNNFKYIEIGDTDYAETC